MGVRILKKRGKWRKKLSYSIIAFVLLWIDDYAQSPLYGQCCLLVEEENKLDVSGIDFLYRIIYILQERILYFADAYHLILPEQYFDHSQVHTHIIFSKKKLCSKIVYCNIFSSTPFLTRQINRQGGLSWANLISKYIWDVPILRKQKINLWMYLQFIKWK